MVEIAAQEHLVHAAQVLLVQQVVIAQQLTIELDLGGLQLDVGRLLGFVGHRVWQSTVSVQ